jgi:hypothetical protein
MKSRIEIANTILANLQSKQTQININIGKLQSELAEMNQIIKSMDEMGVCTWSHESLALFQLRGEIEREIEVQDEEMRRFNDSKCILFSKDRTPSEIIEAYRNDETPARGNRSPNHVNYDDEPYA